MENTFGILVTKWRIFRQPIIAKPDNVDLIVKAACVLHNYLRRRDGVSNDMQYIPPGDVDQDVDGQVNPGAWRSEAQGSGLVPHRGPLASNAHSRNAAEVRKRYAELFVSPRGAVPWQWSYVRRGRLN